LQNNYIVKSGYCGPFPLDTDLRLIDCSLVLKLVVHVIYMFNCVLA